jgi:hypothetical protein
VTTSREVSEYVVEQLRPLDVRARAMFGGYCLYCDNKPVALVCGETLYLKITAASDGRGLREDEAYEGSRPHRVVGPDLIGKPEELQALVQATADELPLPKPKRPRASAR